ncbi:hypothetical protein [Neolewinella persica]|uniref:hypothetical protein n=1 Tax=Neolewinella persica TaxID=70998 RepID=UPI00036C64E1|nr:hypothetical protein [Neolewinella persica]
MASSTVKAFVSSCQAFSDGSSGDKDIATLQKVAERQMPLQYSMPFPEPEVSQVAADRKEDARNLRAIWHELVQHLRDLRYLSEAQFIFYHKHKKNILTDPRLQDPVVGGVRHYLAEEKQWPELKHILPPGGTVDRLFLQAHLATIVDRIGFHTCWDGAGIVPDKYKIGEQSVFSRALSYRLRTLSSSQFDLGPLSDYYSGENLDVLNTMFEEGFNVTGKAREQSIPRGFWTKMTSIDALLVSYVNNTEQRKKNPPLRYQLVPPEADTFVLLEKLTPKDFRNEKATKVSNKYYHIPTVNRIRRGARKKNHRPDNGLDIRLLQIKLWQTGYYTGTIDEKWEALSHVALKHFLMDEADFTAEAIDPAPKDPDKFEKFLKKKQPETARKVRSLLVKINDDNEVYAADFIAIIQVFTNRIASREREMVKSTNLDDEEDMLQKLPAKAGISNEAFDSHILGETGVGELFPDNTLHTKRRVSFFRKVGGFIVGGLEKVVDWLKKSIKVIGEALSKLLGPVFTFIKKMLRPIRNAIDRFFQGFKYLSHFVFGRPLVTETAPATATEPPRIFATKFQLDFDAINYVPAGFGPEEPGQHASHIKRMQEDMLYFIDSALWIIRAIGKLTSPGGWVWLGWQIMKSIVKGVPVLNELWQNKDVVVA